MSNSRLRHIKSDPKIKRQNSLVITFILLIICLLANSNNISAQSISNKKISFEIKDVTVSSALETLYKQYNFKLAFSSSECRTYGDVFYLKRYLFVGYALSRDVV